MMFFSLSSTQWRRGAGRGGAFGWIAPLSGSLPPPSSRGERDKALIVIRLSSIAGILHPPQGVRHAQAHGLQRGKNSRDQTERDTEAQADEQIPGWKKEHRQQAAVSQSMAGAHGNAMAAEDALVLQNFLGKSFLIECKRSGRTNRHAYAVSLA